VRPVGLDLLPDAFVKLNETLIGHIRETGFHLCHFRCGGSVRPAL
jgi:hypothetical protein